MPFGDGTGPLGLGPGTGRGLGPCGRGLAWRRGQRYFGRWWRGYGFRNWGWGANQWNYPLNPPTLSENEEKQLLEQDLKDLKEEITAIEKRLEELKKK